MSENTKKGEQFLKDRFGVSFSSGSQRIMSYDMMNNHYPIDIDPASYRFHDHPYHVESSVDICFSKKQYERFMQAMEWWSETSIKDIEYGEYLELKQQHKEEKQEKLHSKYPALRKAYDNYQTLRQMIEDDK